MTRSITDAQMGFRRGYTLHEAANFCAEHGWAHKLAVLIQLISESSGVSVAAARGGRPVEMWHVNDWARRAAEEAIEKERKIPAAPSALPIPDSPIPASQAKRGASFSTTSFPMFKLAVAAGDGAFSTFTTRSVSAITKSSTIFPSGLTVWARTPAGAQSRNSLKLHAAKSLSMCTESRCSKCFANSWEIFRLRQPPGYRSGNSPHTPLPAPSIS